MTVGSVGTRAYRRLLRLYPREFREEYGDEMASVYRHRAADEGAIRLWLALLVDVVRTAPREHVSVLGEKLSIVRPDAVDNFASAGRPIASISNVMLEYRPGPPPKKAPAKKAPAKKP